MIKNNKVSNGSLIFLLSFLLIAVITTVFGQTLFFDFVNYDDPLYIGELSRKSFVGFFDAAKWAFTYTETGDWHPFVWLSWLLDKQLYGLNPMGYHFTNVLLHIFVTLLFFTFLRLVTGCVWKSFVVALIFSIHPMRVESVAWVAERKDLFSAFWMMLTLCAYTRYAQIKNKKLRIKNSISNSSFLIINFWYFLTLIFYACGLMTKPMLVTLPILMLLVDYWPLQRWKNKGEQGKTGYKTKHRDSKPFFFFRFFPCSSFFILVIEKIPFFVLAAASVYMTLEAIQELQHFIPVDPPTWVTRIKYALAAHGDYLYKFFWPKKLTFFYWKPEGVPVLWVFLAAFMMIVISFISLWQIKKRPYLIVGWLWFLVTLAPVSGWIPMGSAWKADRYTYFAHMGFLVSFVWFMSEVLKSWIQTYRKIFIGVLSLVVFAYMGIAHSYTAKWKNSKTLNEYGIKISSDNYRAYNNLGVIYLKQKDFVKAAELFSKAKEANPQFAKAYRNLGQCYFNLEKWDKAYENFKEATKMLPRDSVTHFSLGQIYADRERIKPAIAHLEVGLKFEPYPPVGVFRTLARLWRKNGNLERSIEYYKRALEFLPDDPAIHNNLGNVYYMNQDFENAKIHFEKTVAIDPGHDNANKLLKLIELRNL